MTESNFQFLGYRITKIECKIDDSYGHTQDSFKQDIKVENNFDESRKGFVEVVMNISIKTDSDSFSFFLTIKGGFQADESIEKELFYKLAQQNGPAILFPFARGIITSYTAQANIPPIILPTVNFTANK